MSAPSQPEASASQQQQQMKTNPRGIPHAPFIQNVQQHLGGPDEDVEPTLRKFQETMSKYKFMEVNTAQRRAGLEDKIPDIRKTLQMVEFLSENKDKEEPIKTTFELNETLYAKAELQQTDKVHLWLGANVMLSYPLDEAIALLTTKLKAAETSLVAAKEDLDFLREQITIMEVNTARVHNWDVKRRRERREELEKQGIDPSSARERKGVAAKASSSWLRDDRHDTVETLGQTGATQDKAADVTTTEPSPQDAAHLDPTRSDAQAQLMTGTTLPDLGAPSVRSEGVDISKVPNNANDAAQPGHSSGLKDASSVPDTSASLPPTDLPAATSSSQEPASSTPAASASAPAMPAATSQASSASAPSQPAVSAVPATPAPAPALIQSHLQPNFTVVPPLNFDMVCPGVYRSGHPNERNFGFLKRLDLKSVMYLANEEYRTNMTTWARSEGIKVFHFRLDLNKEPLAEMDSQAVTSALLTILDPTNLPMLLHCNKGKYRVGCIAGLLRRLQGWSHTSIFEEYARFAGSRIADMEFVEVFDLAPVYAGAAAKGAGR